MRDPVRIDNMLMLIREIWIKNPDLRLGQILANASHHFERNVFYEEDEALFRDLLAFKDLLERYPS